MWFKKSRKISKLAYFLLSSRTFRFRILSAALSAAPRAASREFLDRDALVLDAAARLRDRDGIYHINNQTLYVTFCGAGTLRSNSTPVPVGRPDRPAIAAGESAWTTTASNPISSAILAISSKISAESACGIGTKILWLAPEPSATQIAPQCA